IFVILFEERIPCAPWRVVFAGCPTSEEYHAGSFNRCCAVEAHQASDKPVLLASLNIVTFEPRRTRNDHLVEALVSPANGCPKTANRIGPRRFPQHFSGG